MLTPLKKTKLYEEISKQIISLINSGELKPGDKLPPERSLAEQLNVSRTAIREALRALESMGYIESKVGGGTFVREISLENIISPVSAMFQQDESLLKDLIAVRLLLETEMASLAAKHITPEKAMKIEEAIVLMRKEVAKGEIGLRGDNSFHAALAEASGNSAMSLISDMCMELLSKTRL
ncbi:MAG: FadR family transcriptional regulator, partial [Christensenellaceae bacterium]|nr:FadR family transcriptional regulator [Christensenellaceae bacterium]